MLAISESHNRGLRASSPRSLDVATLASNLLCNVVWEMNRRRQSRSNIKVLGYRPLMHEVFALGCPWLNGWPAHNQSSSITSDKGDGVWP